MFRRGGSPMVWITSVLGEILAEPSVDGVGQQRLPSQAEMASTVRQQSEPLQGWTRSCRAARRSALGRSGPGERASGGRIPAPGFQAVHPARARQAFAEGTAGGLGYGAQLWLIELGKSGASGTTLEMGKVGGAAALSLRPSLEGQARLPLPPDVEALFQLFAESAQKVSPLPPSSGCFSGGRHVLQRRTPSSSTSCLLAGP